MPFWFVKRLAEIGLYRSQERAQFSASAATQPRKLTRMKITKKVQVLALAALWLGITSVCVAQSDAPYTEGPVWTVTMVKTKTGMTDEYLKELAKTLKASLEE